MPNAAQFVASAAAAPVGLLRATAQDASRLRYALPELGYVVREVRGAKMPTVSAVFDEFAAAFQFPYYFGENKDAFDECMRDLEEFVGPARGYVVLVRDAELLLGADPDAIGWFFEAMSFYAQEWSDRTEPAVFRVVLQVERSLPKSWPTVQTTVLTLD
ncbi:barstar family protein [Antrihabitans sp. YC2-6]|uniref:barstar family protein n=1 Tax=Antrihabitans sp. YC2-6 TaxID=2799498 RepID=UPI0018F72233|nr:barstar family protein [Antrihabitans sp. YC2-6]MBJ8347389.1 barstar family protein [Antrihabitans sp. YC2-6]